MRILVLITILCLSSAGSVNAQTLRIFHEDKNNDFVLYAENKEFCPVSLSLDLNILNMAFSAGERRLFLVPSQTARFKIGELSSVNPNSKTNFSYNYKTALGDVAQKSYDTSFAYNLPFPKGKSFKVIQGYNGSLSHRNEQSLDFNMPEGTEIEAARGGIVVQVVQNNTESCPQEKCKQYNNYVIIMHTDGTFANYAHIKQNSSKYKIGDNIKKGDIIAYSGNVGWSTGPHLHFACFLGGFEKWKTIETQFRLDKGDSVGILKEGNEYLRNY